MFWHEDVQILVSGGFVVNILILKESSYFFAQSSFLYIIAGVNSGMLCPILLIILIAALYKCLHVLSVNIKAAFWFLLGYILNLYALTDMYNNSNIVLIICRKAYALRHVQQMLFLDKHPGCARFAHHWIRNPRSYMRPCVLRINKLTQHVT